MSRGVIPTARALIVCDAVARTVTGKVHVSGVYDAIRARRFPHATTRLVVFAQLSGGVGDVPFLIDVRNAAEDRLVYTTGRSVLRFPDRLRLVQLSVALPRISFPSAGFYTVELFCHGQFVCDTLLRLIPGDDSDGG